MVQCKLGAPLHHSSGSIPLSILHLSRINQLIEKW
jgi:hypothetical protein